MVIKKLMASGETARSIEAVVQDDEAGTVLQILSNLALLTLSEPYPYLGIRGGRGRNVKSSGGLKPAIRKWIDTKGITPYDPKMTKDQLAYVITRKIAREGISVPNKHNPGGVLSEVINPELINEIYQEVKKVTKDRIFTMTRRAIR